MSGDLRLLNRQRAARVDLRRLRETARALLEDLLELEAFDLTIQLVNATEMARLNKQHLGHAGSTDVITLDYGDAEMAGELFVCVAEARAQARRFRVPWTRELARYIVHGVLHLRGYDDRQPAARRRMKRAENSLLRQLDRCAGLRGLALKTSMKR